MPNKFPSLTTPNAHAGLVLAGQMADQLHAQIDEARNKVQGPGGMSYGVPAPVPKEITTSILFYAVAAANHGWSKA